MDRPETYGHEVSVIFFLYLFFGGFKSDDRPTDRRTEPIALPRSVHA